jgi:ferredoxin
MHLGYAAHIVPRSEAKPSGEVHRAVHRVRFLPSGREVESPPGTTLLDATVAAGLPIARSCGAEGVCAKCALQIVAGAEHLSPEAPDETRIKARNRIEPALRLACRATLCGDVIATAAYW